MHNDKLMIAIINFLVPFIMLYAFFVISDYAHNGFFSLIYATILLIITFLIYSTKFTNLKFSSLISIKIISSIGLLIAITYLTIILFLLIGLMPEIRI